MAGITKESNPVCQGCTIWGACTGGYMGETPPCGRVAQNSASTNSASAEICSDNICQYCKTDQSQRRACDGCYNHSEFVGRKLRT